MALFDQLVLEDEVPKVVDLGHQPFDRFFAVMQQIDFAAEVRRRAIAPMVLFLADPDERARQGYAMLSDRFPDLPLVPVFNENVPQIRALSRELPADAAGRRTDRHPGADAGGALGGRPAEFLVRHLCPAISNDNTSELYQWLGRVFISFRELEVRLLLGDIAPQLKHSA